MTKLVYKKFSIALKMPTEYEKECPKSKTCRPSFKCEAANQASDSLDPVEFPFPGTQDSECTSCQSAGLPAADVAPCTMSRSYQPKETGNVTIGSRCQMCPVMRKISQSWHSWRTEGQRQPIARSFQPQACPPARRPWWSRGVDHGFSTSGPASS